MAVDDLTMMPTAASLDGTEELRIVQKGFPFKTTAAMVAALGGGSALASVTAVLAATTITELTATQAPGYVAGTTNRLLLTAASGGTTINTLDAAAAADGFGWFIQNKSTTDSLVFPHLASGAGLQFSNANAGSVAIPPLGAARLTKVGSILQFA